MFILFWYTNPKMDGNCQKGGPMKKAWYRKLLRRRILIALMIVLQAAFLLWLIISGSRTSQWLNVLFTLISMIAVLAVVTRKDKGAYKTMWVFLILLFPVFGGLLYIYYRCQSPTRQMRRDIEAAEAKARPLYLLPETGYDCAKETVGADFPQVRYLQDYVGYPVYQHTQTSYYSPGEKMMEALLPELEKAEKYIFLEYFIVQEGRFWDSILEILKRKASQGVEVRLLFDDMGCFFLLPVNYRQQMEEAGISCGVFNPFRPFLTAKQNNRDHRKITSIDGKVAFTGGVNLADEYINEVERFGHFKDSAVKLEGEAAWSLTLIFLQMWQVCQGTDEDFAAFYPWKDTPCPVENDGFVAPYADHPLDTEHVGEHVYLQILNQATDYVYIFTPYLVIDDSVLSAMCLAAKRGVDVRVITPHVPDKWYVHTTTRSYYRDLLEGGVRVYEYTPGFIHSKCFVSDDRIATVGTINLDFRSLYLHFECGTWMWGSRAVGQLKQDVLDTLAISQEVTREDCKVSVLKGFVQNVLRLFAPLM